MLHRSKNDFEKTKKFFIVPGRTVMSLGIDFMGTRITFSGPVIDFGRCPNFDFLGSSVNLIMFSSDFYCFIVYF